MASPGNKMHFDMKAEDIASEAEKLMKSAKTVYDSVGALKADDVKYDNVIKVIFCLVIDGGW